jgi:hypothetical protein
VADEYDHCTRDDNPPKAMYEWAVQEQVGDKIWWYFCASSAGSGKYAYNEESITPYDENAGVLERCS